MREGVCTVRFADLIELELKLGMFGCLAGVLSQRDCTFT